MIKFIYGTAGSGKTTMIYEQALSSVRSGGRVILLVPEQQVLLCERALARLAGNGVPLGLEVLSFRRLANTVFRAEGGLRYNYITRGQKTVLLWRALQSVAPTLQKYDTLSLKDRGFLSEAVSCIEEFKAYRITPAALMKAAEEMPSDRRDLSRKLCDLSVMYSAYTETLAHGYSDPSDDLEALLGILETSDFLRDYEVYLDSFNGYTAIELALVRRIFESAKSCTVTVGYDRSTSIAYESIAEADRRLRSAASECGKETEEIFLTDAPRYRQDDLRYLSAHLWDFSAPEYNGQTQSIRVLRTHDVYSECEVIARDIHRRVREGARYRDFAVILRGTESYAGIIDAVFEKYALPCFLSRRTDISLSPSVKCLLSALSVYISGWRTDDVLSYLKCDLAGVSPDECNLLENYVQTWGIQGRRWHDEYDWNMNPDGYTEELSEQGAALLTALNGLRKRITAPLLALFEAFDRDATVASVTAALWSFAESICLKDQIERTEDEQAARVWNCLLDSLDSLVHCAGEVRVSAEMYRDLLLTILSEMDIGSIPAGGDEITVGDAALLRLHDVEHVYVAGVNEGVFPRSVGEDPILSDAEKKTLNALGITLGADTALRSAEELFYLWRAVSTPRSTLTVTYPVATLSGEALAPSLGVARIKKLFPTLTPENADDIPPIDRVENYHSSFELAALYQDTPLGQALFDLYQKDEAYAGRIRALKTPLVNGKNALSPDLAEQVFPQTLNLTQSRLEKFSGCEFAYHCSYVLRLGEQRTPAFSSLDIGNFVHALLERFMSRLCATGEPDFDLPEEQIGEIIDTLIEEYIGRIFRDKHSASPRLLTLISRLRRTTLLLIRNIMTEFRQSEFRPAYFELPIAGDDPDSLAPYDIALPDGGTVRLYGKIDRVDTFSRDGKVYVRIVDYKTGTKELSVSKIKKGQEMQMLLYLFAIWKSKDAAFLKRMGAEPGNLLPAGAQYFMARLPSLKLEQAIDGEELREQISLHINRSGISLADEEVARAQAKDEKSPFHIKETVTLEQFGELLELIEKTVCDIGTRMKSGSANAQWTGDPGKPCQYCSMRPVCRKEQ